LRQALMPPFLLAAAILIIAGVAKLRAPGGVATAMRVLGLPPALARPLARVLGGAEIALGALAAVAPLRSAAIAVAVLYLLFALSAMMLARRLAACGCFGAADSPASMAQTLLSAGLGAAAAVAAISPPHGLAWMLGQPMAPGLALIVGIAGAAYGTVLVYTELPSAWNAWRGSAR
jgi:hypothetical protein